jgi:hypothetical protein
MGASIMATRQNSDLTQLMSLLSTEQYIVFFNDYIPTAKLSSFAGESCAEDVDIGLNTDSSQRIDLLIPRQKIVHSLSALLISIGCRPCGHSGTRQATVKSAIIISTGSAASIQETLLREFQAINCHVWMVICSKLLSNSCTKEWLNVQLNSFDMMRVMR